MRKKTRLLFPCKRLLPNSKQPSRSGTPRECNAIGSPPCSKRHEFQSPAVVRRLEEGSSQAAIPASSQRQGYFCRQVGPGVERLCMRGVLCGGASNAASDFPLISGCFFVCPAWFVA